MSPKFLFHGAPLIHISGYVTGRKVVNLKSVAMALHTHVMSCVKLPEVICADLGRHMARSILVGRDKGEEENAYIGNLEQGIYVAFLFRIRSNILLIWKCINGILPIQENLFRRRVTREMLCINCKGDCETFPHLFMECQCAHIM